MTIDNPRADSQPALKALWKQAFGDSDAFLRCFFTRAFSPSRCRCVWEKGSLAAALYWFDCTWEEKKIAYLYAVATQEAMRGRGLCRALMEDTHRHLRSLGYAGCILVPGSPELFGMYEKLGYTVCSQLREFSCEAANALPLRQLSAEEFALLRRERLPSGGVLQEGATLAFLQTQAKFYAGETFLAVCSATEEGCLISELLGEEAAAPGIFAALGYSRGRVRMPGEGTPFAMYRALTDAPGAPAYFGLAMD